MTTSSALITLAVGGGAGSVAALLRAPGGAITWSLLAVAVLHLGFPALEPLDQGFRIAAQIMIGTVIGSSLHREPFGLMRTILWPVVVTVAGILTAALAAGLVLSTLSDLSLFSALLAVVPGGATDVTAVALELDQDVAVVAGFQMLRQLAIFGVVAAVFQWIFRGPVEGPGDRADEPDG